jgi:type II secretion system protein H
LQTTNHELRASHAGRHQRFSACGCSAAPWRARHSSGFTLIELILVMALLVIAVSLVAPHLSGFARGRALNSEAKQILALMHEGQSRAVSAGVPMVLWFDTDKGKYGLEEEPGYVDKDPNAVEYELNENLKIEVPDYDSTAAALTSTARDTERQGLPQITFLSDGTVAEGSPATVRIVDTAGPSVSLTQSRDRNQYEIKTPQQ